MERRTAAVRTAERFLDIIRVVREKTDRELWERAHEEPEVFGALFDRHARNVYNFCFRCTGDWSQAEELVSEVFLTAWRRRDDVRMTSRSGSALPWLLAVALNQVRNRRRARVRLLNAFRRLRNTNEQPDFSDEVIERVTEEQRMQAILEVVRTLPRPELDVLALFVWGELHYTQIAEALDIPVGTVRSRLSRARASLKDLMETENQCEIGTTPTT